MSVDTAAIRNIAFVGHPSAGKTSLIDALAWALGASDRRGSVPDKTSICDTEPEEHEKGHTLQLKVVHAAKNGAVLNLFDTPGYPDFAAEALSAQYGSELSVGVVSATSGVTFNLRKKMAQAAGLGRGRALVVTHLDAENTDFDALVAKLRSGIGDVCVPLMTPDASGHGFSAVRPVLADAQSEWRRPLMDRVMDACEDEALLTRYLETETLSDAELHQHLPVAIARGTLVPILVCNPTSGLAVDQVLSFLVEYGPSPATAAGFRLAKGLEVVCPDPAGELLGVVFGVRSDPHVGKVSLVRVLRGTLRASDHLRGPRNEKGEKIGALFHMVGGRKRDPAESAVAGEIVAFSKVEQLRWGESFTAVGHEPAAAVVVAMPEPMVSMAVTPKSRADEQKIGDALHKLEAEDPTFRMSHVAETHELVITGMSELHLRVIEARLKRRYGVEVSLALPRIPYRETVTKPTDSHYRHKKQSGGRGQFGECYLRIRPGVKDSGLVFKDEVVGGSIPRNLIPAVEKGVREVAAKGVLIHSVVVDVEVEVYDGKYHDVDSDEASFKIAGGRAFREGFLKAGPVLLEPVMEIEVHVPTEAAGTIFSDITSHRRGHVIDQSTEADGGVTFVKAHVPLSMIQTYDRDLKSQTAGEGYYTMRFERYAPVPAGDQSKITAQLARQHEEE